MGGAEKLSSDGSEPERQGILGGLAHRVQEGVRATIDAVRHSHAQQLAAIVESSNDAIISIDLNGIIATWNRGAAKLYGFQAEDVIGRPNTLIIPPELQDKEA